MLTIREIQLETLKILEVIDKISNKIGIKYVLVWGSLIGAVRHKGFIPWDDDLDIMMSRKDYEKLQDYFIKNKDALKPFEFFSKETRNEYPYMIGRICNTNFKMISENEKDYGMGTFVDIYPLDGAGNGKDKFLYKRACLCTTMMGMKTRLHFNKTFSAKKNVLKFIIYQVSKIFSEKFFEKKLIKYGKKYSYESSDYLNVMQWCDGGMTILFKKNIFEDVLYVPFEDLIVPIPKDYDEILRNIYGDYMKLPPENERVGHHYYTIERK